MPNLSTKPLTSSPDYVPSRNDGTFPESKTPKRRIRPDTPAPDEWVKRQFDTSLNENKEAEDERTKDSVLLAKRHRGSTISDRIGVISADGRRWLDVDVSNIRSLNIVKPAVNYQTNTVAQATIGLKVEPATSQFKGAASVAFGISEDFDSKQWTEQLKFLVSEKPQLSCAIFLRAFFDRECGESMSVPEIIDTEVDGTGKYACGSCGMHGDFSSADLVDLAEDTPDPTEKPTDIFPKNLAPTFYCPECGGEAEITEMPENEFVPVVNYKDAESGISRIETVSSFEVRIDPKGTEGGDFKKGEYFERHYLRTRTWVEEHFPHFKAGEPDAPSYSLKWQHALQNKLKSARENWEGSKTNKDADLFEIRELYVKPTKYKSYTAPSPYTFRDDYTNEAVFDIQQGEGWEDAIKRQKRGRCNKNKHILFVSINGKPAAAPAFADFCKEYSMIQFSPDAFSAWGEPFSIILSVQNDVNDLNTIIMMHLEKNSISNVAVDIDYFDFEDFENDFVPTKQGVQSGDDIRKHFAVIEPPRLGNEPVGYLTFLLSAQRDLSGVQPAAVGASQPGQPYHAQLLQANQSQGLLTLFALSIAQGKVDCFKNYLRTAQDDWSEEQYENIRTRYGAEWKDDDLENFYNCNIDDDLLLSFVEGSEVPKTIIQRELAVQNAISQVLQFVQAAPGTVRQETIDELFAEAMSNAGLSIDVGNYEGDRRLAQARVERIKAGVEAFSSQGYQIPMNPATGEPMFEQAVLRIIQQGRCAPNPKAENHESQKEFWADQIRSLEASDDANELLLASYDMMWTLHSEAQTQMAQLATQQQIDANAPLEAHQQQLQQAQMAQQSEAQNAQVESQNATQQQQQALQLESEQAKRDHEDEKTIVELADKERQRQHEKELAQGEAQQESFVVG